MGQNDVILVCEDIRRKYKIHHSPREIAGDDWSEKRCSFYRNTKGHPESLYSKTCWLSSIVHSLSTPTFSLIARYFSLSSSFQRASVKICTRRLMYNKMGWCLYNEVQAILSEELDKNIVSKAFWLKAWATDF